MAIPTANDPRRCRAHNRAGGQCGKWAVPGHRVCHFHGVRKTAAGNLASATTNITNGSRTTLTTYQRLLSVAAPEAFMAAGSGSSLGDELRYARARLVTLVDRENRGEKGLDAPIIDAMEAVRKCALAQKDVAPGADASGAFTLNIKVVGGEADDPAPNVSQTAPHWIHGASSS